MEKSSHRSIYHKVLKEPSVNCIYVPVMPIYDQENWMNPIVRYLQECVIPEDREERKKLLRNAARFCMIDGKLYKRSYCHPYLKCVDYDEGNYLLREVHEGICGLHMGARSLAYKIMRQGYYWPIMKQDAETYVKTCKKCQVHANIPHQPAVPLTSITSPWPFVQWGMDILGPFPEATGQRKFLIVAIDYFTKWVEAEALAKITGQNIVDFVWKNIFFRFGVPHTVITDNGKKFDCAKFKQFCEGLKITQRFTSVAYPQCNGHAEVTNREIFKGLKKRLDQSKGLWAIMLNEAILSHSPIKT